MVKSRQFLISDPLRLRRKAPDVEHGVWDRRIGGPFHVINCHEYSNFFVGLNCTMQCIGVGAQSTLGARHFCPKNMYEKIIKMPEFYIIIARKIVSRLFLGGGGRASTHAPRLLRRWRSAHLTTGLATVQHIVLFLTLVVPSCQFRWQTA